MVSHAPARARVTALRKDAYSVLRPLETMVQAASEKNSTLVLLFSRCWPRSPAGFN
jgi:hypothetical protein